MVIYVPKFAMKFYVLLVLCFAVALGEKKINLEDIERDNLKSEAQSEQENVRSEDTKHSSDKTDGNPQLQYQSEARFGGGQQHQEFKYVIQPEAYNQDLGAYQQQQYSGLLANQQLQAPQQYYTTIQQEHGGSVLNQEQQTPQQFYTTVQQQHGGSVSNQEQQAPQQFYTTVQQQHGGSSSSQQQRGPQQFYTTAYQTEAAYQSPKSSPQISYQPQLTQGLTYQPEISVGNQIQSYQQKVATQKFGSGLDKAARYENVAASGNQQLLYYPTTSAAPIKKPQLAQPLLHRLASQAAKNAKLPAYTTSVSQGSKVSYQPQPQIQYVYEPQYIQPANPTYTPKSSQKFTYAAAAAAPQTYSLPQAYSGLTYNQESSLPTQSKLAYTQAYYIQPQSPQYYQEPAYTPGLEGNSLSYSQSQPFYLPSNLAQQLSSQILEQQSSHSISQNYAKIPQEPRYTLTVPQIPTQSFNTRPITQHRPVHSGASQYSNQLSYSSGSKSLLESYTPSHIIAAQDSERYRERPLHLEGGFLPSKGTFAHSYNQKRKSE